MALSPLAGKPVPSALLDNIPKLMVDYYVLKPDMDMADQRVSFGTSGHRGSSSKVSFNEMHIAAICQALVEFRQQQKITGPIFLGMDTHALSEAAHATALCVFIANNVKVIVQGNGRFTPTPVISNAILRFNRDQSDALADGVIITPSHNPPADGGFKYNATDGGPADGDVTAWVENRANAILEKRNVEVTSMTLAAAELSPLLKRQDLITHYISALGDVIDMQAIKNADIRIGVDPMGSAAIDYWPAIADMFGLNITVVNKTVDPRFSFMNVDSDGLVRMDCSSRHAMAGLIEMKDDFDIAFANDPDVDRHGIVTPSAGLMNPNHYLAVVIQYLFTHRKQWPDGAAIGKTLVSSAMIDRVAASINRLMLEVPVGFKWFVKGLWQGEFAFAGEESAGASFLCFDGSPWSTDKDGIILNLLAAEIRAVTGKDPSQLYHELTEQFGAPVYARISAPAGLEEKAKFKLLTPESVTVSTLAGDIITQKLTQAPGNGADIGGLKVCTDNGWFAARPSGTEDIYKIYAESFLGADHLQQILDQAQRIVDAALT